MFILVESLLQYEGVPYHLNSPTDKEGERGKIFPLFAVFKSKYIMSNLHSTCMWFILIVIGLDFYLVSVFPHLELQVEMQGD